MRLLLALAALCLTAGLAPACLDANSGSNAGADVHESTGPLESDTTTATTADPDTVTATATAADPDTATATAADPDTAVVADTEAPADTAEPVDTTDPRSPECHDRGGDCWSDYECCGGFCQQDPASPYVQGACADYLWNGATCAWDGWCVSGNCDDGVCASGDCKAEGAACDFSNPCCSGPCSNEVDFSYAPGVCLPPLPADAVCYDDRWCASGHCVEYECTAP
ncbi:MAG: hypothetical protein H6745_02205 [Deltaproteobacteria bacterium]|nr:hypothetical protein [Deltaproteobacteria bacterium]